MELVNWKVEGMTCANCALTITQYLNKEGLQNIKVNPVSGDVSFELIDATKKDKLTKGIDALGYKVVQTNGDRTSNANAPTINRYLRYVLLTLPFTLILMLHMFENWIHIHWLMNPWVQLMLCVPVYIIGMQYFGKSAIKSLRNGIPNMNVLIALGATAAFAYSLVGTLIGQAEQYMFYETAATIITLVFLGNYMEDASIQHTQRALKKLVQSQKVMANMIAFDDQHQEVIMPVENTVLKTGDLILIKSGEQVPADCKILWGNGIVNESIVTGESLPIAKSEKQTLIGGSLIEEGTIKAMVTAEAKDSVLANIVQLVKQAQGEKPPVQQLADKISAIFVPTVIGIAVLAFIINFVLLDAFTPALMRSIAILVIACPCAMGLATPAAIAVGLGRAARNGILFRNAKSLELFKNIRQVVFDKTGTLTTGQFDIAGFNITDQHTNEDQFKCIAYSLEKYSGHPLAKCIAVNWKRNDDIRWSQIEEIKGMGMRATSKEGETYIAGSYKIAAHLTNDESHNIYIVKNNTLIGWIDLQDQLRPEAKEVIDFLNRRNIKTILLSGDRKHKCEMVARQLNISEVLAEQTPEQKLQQLESLTKAMPTAMVGDGINDAPALAKATIGISLSEASQVAMQTADVVLMNHGLKNLPQALGLGKHTFITIKENLFWAFGYNIVAIPVAAFGLLTPTFGALVMGLSDVVLAINSVRLFVKKVV